MRKKILSALLAAAVCLTLMPGVVAAGMPYSDVPADHWSIPSIERATELGIFNGIGEGLFGFGQSISRAAFVTALVRMFEWENVVPVNPTFDDVRPGEWYYSAVETAAKNGVIPAASKSFRPTAELSRGEMAAMLIRALGYTSLAGTVSSLDCPFTDVTTNRGFITMAYDMGIVSGMGDGTFAPSAAATREQAAAILVRLCDRMNAESTEVDGVQGRTVLRVETPEAEEGSELPTTPLEPIAQLYEELCKLKHSGEDMSEVVLVLCAGGVRTIVSNEGKIVSTDRITKTQVERIFERYNARPYYSRRYESAYCVYEPNFYQTVTVWYQSEESLAVKLQLARMFGVTHFILE